MPYAAHTVLIAEDNAGLRKVLALNFLREGFLVLESSYAREALKLIHWSSPDAVVVDLLLADGPAIPLLMRLRDLDRRSCHPPLWCAISALDPAEAEKRFGPLGCKLIPKPLIPFDLVRRLQDELASR